MTKERHKPLDSLNALALAAVGFGIVVRIAQFISNRSLWGDEAWLALNVIDRSYQGLLQPLDHNQAAPVGFLWLQKLAVQLFGDSEYAHRLFPLIAGVVSVIAIYKLGKGVVSALALPIAVALFACLKYPLYYATEAKPYSSDVMVALLLSLLLIPLRAKQLSKGQRLLAGFAGGVTVWVSYPAIFVLTGLEVIGFILSPGKQPLARLINRSPVYLTWVVSFLASYLLVTAKVASNQGLQSAWNDEYPKSIFDLLWLLDSLGRFFYHPLGFLNGMDGVAIVAFILGCLALLKRDREKLFILFAPIAVTLMAGYLHKYHFRARLVLFLTPFFILIIAEGVAFLLSQFKQRPILGVLGLVMTGLLLFPPLTRATQLIVDPEKKQELRPVIEYIKSHQRAADQIYVDYGAVLQFSYYAPKFNLAASDYIHGDQNLVESDTFSKQQWQEFAQLSGRLQPGQRVWFVFSGLNHRKEQALPPRLAQIGEKIDSFKQPGVSTYLYKLR